MRFYLEETRRFNSTIISIYVSIEGNEDIIGSITLYDDQKDLFPFIQTMINGFNSKYIEDPPQTRTG